MALENIGATLAGSLGVLWDNFLVSLPRTVAAVVIIVVGYLISAVVGKLLKTSLNRAKFDAWLEKKGKEEIFGGIELSALIGSLVKWWMFVLFLVPAVNVLDFGQLSSIVSGFASWFPNLVLAIVIIFVGLIFANFLSSKVLQVRSLKGMKGLGTIVKVALILIFADIALRQVGVEVMFAETVALIVLAGVMLAIAIGFGLGLKEYAEEVVHEVKKKFR